MTVLITLTTAGTDTGPFDLYSNVDGYVSAFETGVSKAALLAGYSSALVPNGTTTIRIKSTGICVNYIDVLVITTTTTTSSTTSTSSTTTTTTTTFNCDTDCRNWEYLGASIPIEGDTITYYSCIDGTTQSISLSNGDSTASFCNCNTVGTPTSLNGTTLTEIGICVTTTTTTTTATPTTTTTTTVEPTTTTTTTTVVCTDCYNNTGTPILATYYDCSGTYYEDESVTGGQSICVQGAFCPPGLDNIGNC